MNSMQSYDYNLIEALSAKISTEQTDWNIEVTEMNVHFNFTFALVLLVNPITLFSNKHSPLPLIYTVLSQSFSLSCVWTRKTIYISLNSYWLKYVRLPSTLNVTLTMERHDLCLAHWCWLFCCIGLVLRVRSRNPATLI